MLFHRLDHYKLLKIVQVCASNMVCDEEEAEEL